MIACVAIIGAGFLGAVGWFGANQYVIDPYLKQLPAPAKYEVPQKLPTAQDKSTQDRWTDVLPVKE